MARLQEGARIVMPTLFIEVDGQEETALIEQHRVHAGDKIVASVVRA
jgi:hypothetical protein